MTDAEETVKHICTALTMTVYVFVCILTVLRVHDPNVSYNSSILHKGSSFFFFLAAFS